MSAVTARAAGALVALLVAATALPLACSSDRRFPTADDLGGIDLTPGHVITVDADGFDPPALEVVSGEVILLVNEGDGPHSFSAETRFDTGLMEPGEETVLLLEEAGEIPYTDRTTDHTGTLTVVDGG